VRLAFCLAIDRDRLANVTLRGEFYPAAGGFVPPGMPGHSPGIALPYDPERARQLLGQAGYPNGRGFPPLEAWASATPSFVRPIIAQCLAPAWRDDLGVEITWTEMEAGSFFHALDAQPPNLWELGWLADYPDPDSFLSASPWKRQTRWHNAAFEALVDGAGRVMGQEERMRMYHQADRILVQEAPILPLVYLREHLLVKPWVTRLAASPDGHRFWQDVIIEPH
jgi:oligopeptide transport system substrate-binding protein